MGRPLAARRNTAILTPPVSHSGFYFERSDGAVKPVADFDATEFFADKSSGDLVTYSGWKAIELVEMEQVGSAESCYPDNLKPSHLQEPSRSPLADLPLPQR